MNACVSGKVVAGRALALEEVHRVEPQAVHTKIEPEAHDVEHGVLHTRVVEIQIRLVAEEAVPVERTGLGVPGPVAGLGVMKD